MSGNASAASDDLAAQSKRKPVAEIQSQSERKPDAENTERWISEEEWLNNMMGDPRFTIASGSGERVSIFKIPNLLKDTKREVYVPQSVSLGPYHHGIAELSSMNQYKGRALRSMMFKQRQELSLSNNDMSFANNARKAIISSAAEIRACYEGSIHCDESTLSIMLCLDGCFILAVLKMLVQCEFLPGNINASIVMQDILKLENQVPWVVIRELQGWGDTMTLLDVMKQFICGFFKIPKHDIAHLIGWLQSAVDGAPHLLGFLREVIVDRPSDQASLEHRISIRRCIGWCLQMPPDKNKAVNHDFESIPPALELKNAGIKFRPYNGGIKHIKFDPNSSTIYLPLLYITYDTEVLFRNLMAFEICRPSQVDYVRSYVNLMDDLIDSEKDVAFLRTTGILTNLLGSDKEVADLFNGLFKGVKVRTPNMFDELKSCVNANYKNRIRVQLAELWRDHLSSPWKAIALLVAFAILCLTLIQTIYTVKK